MSMRNKEIIYIVTALILGYIIFGSKGRKSLKPPETSVSQNESPNKQSVGRPPGALPSVAEVEAQLQAKNPKQAAPVVVPIGNGEGPEAFSAKNLQAFKSAAKLEFTAPQKMTFSELDMSDQDVAGTYGLSSDGKSGLAVLATTRQPDEGTVKKFLETERDQIPNLKNKHVNWAEAAETFPAPAASGLSDAKVWTGTDASGNGFAAVLLLRKDGQGSYVFVYNSKGQEIFENDGYFEKVFGDVKAVNP